MLAGGMLEASGTGFALRELVLGLGEEERAEDSQECCLVAKPVRGGRSCGAGPGCSGKSEWASVS